jgi:hypothetical protein
VGGVAPPLGLVAGRYTAQALSEAGVTSSLPHHAVVGWELLL